MFKKLKKQHLFLLVGFVLILAIFLPLKPALAFSVWGKAIASAIVNLVMGIFVLVSIGFISFTEAILRFVLSPYFITLSYTTNPFVTLGWTITREFANMFFAVIIVIIGISTALRINEYQWQKTLPKLIIIALLINFTPVILGLIIDATNIVMNFFIQGISENVVFINIVKTWYQYNVDLVTDVNVGYGEIIFFPFFFIGFNLISGMIYLLFAVLFIFRYAMLWALIIVSPIAFICYILPGTKQVYDMWWKQFIQWCLVGVFGTFFIYLSDQMLYLIMSGEFLREEKIAGIEGWTMVNALMPYFVLVIFLFIGLAVSLSFAPQGTNALFSLAQKGTTSGTAWATKKYFRTLGQVPAVSRATEGTRRRLENAAVINRIPGLKPGTLEKGKGKIIDQTTKELEKTPDTIQGNTDLKKIADQRPLTKDAHRQRAIALNILAKRKELEDKHKSMLNQSQQHGLDVNAILKARPDFASHLTKTDPATNQQVPMTIKEAMTKQEPGEFWKNVQKEAFDNNNVVYEAALHPRLIELGRNAKQEIKKAYKDKFKTLTIIPSDREERRAMIKSAKHLRGPRW
jgi:hypothetical protein